METLILRGVDYILQLLRIREDRDEKKSSEKGTLWRHPVVPLL
jgi:hypothetical protein